MFLRHPGDVFSVYDNVQKEVFALKRTGTDRNWGGARKNAGRKPGDLDEEQRASLVSCFKTWAAKTGRTVPDLLAEIAFSEGADHRVRLKAIEIYYSVTVGKRTKAEHTVEDKRQAPVIGLPPVREKPQEAVDREKEFLGTLQ